MNMLTVGFSLSSAYREGEGESREGTKNEEAADKIRWSLVHSEAAPESNGWSLNHFKPAVWCGLGTAIKDFDGYW